MIVWQDDIKNDKIIMKGVSEISGLRSVISEKKK